MTTPSWLNIGTRSNFAATTTTITPALPASRVNGNLLLLNVGIKSNNTINAPADWYLIEQVNSGTGWTSALLWRIVDGTETAPVLTWASGSAGFAQIIQFTRENRENSNPIGAIMHNTGTATTHTSTGITTTRDNSCVAYVDACGGNTAMSVPSGWTENWDNGNATGASRNGGGTKTVTTTGTASGAISLTGAGAAWVQWQIEILEPLPDPQSGLTYTIGTTSNDCLARSDAAFSNSQVVQGTASGLTFNMGYRFPQILVPKNATITSATLKLTILTNGGLNIATGSSWGRIYGDAKDNPPAWSSSDNPNGITKTTAWVNVLASTVDGAVLDHDVTAIVQEIVNRSGWSVGNAMRFAGDGSTANGRVDFNDYSNNSTLAATLIINYDSGSAIITRSYGYIIG